MASKQHSKKLPIASMAWRMGLAAVAYPALLILANALMAFLGAPAPQVEGSEALVPWLFLSGTVLAIVLGGLAGRVAARGPGSVFVWASLLWLNSLATIIEGLVFAPDLISLEMAPALSAQQLLASVGMAAVLTTLFRGQPGAETPQPLPSRRWHAWLWRLSAVVLAYVALFFVVGGLNYALVTRPFYEQMGELAVPSGSTVLAIESIRGILIAASILPFSLYYQGRKRNVMLATGLALFVVGGVVPLMLQATTLPAFLLVASGWEIFLQLFPTGIITAALFSPSS